MGLRLSIILDLGMVVRMELTSNFINTVQYANISSSIPSFLVSYTTVDTTVNTQIPDDGNPFLQNILTSFCQRYN